MLSCSPPTLSCGRKNYLPPTLSSICATPCVRVQRELPAVPMFRDVPQTGVEVEGRERVDTRACARRGGRRAEVEGEAGGEGELHGEEAGAQREAALRRGVRGLPFGRKIYLLRNSYLKPRVASEERAAASALWCIFAFLAWVTTLHFPCIDCAYHRLYL